MNEVARLGLGEGGFYQPSYGNRGKQRLWMMNMGWRACSTARLGLTAAATSDSRPLLRTDWNLQSRLYEAKRHDYDNATPPAIPQLLTEAFRRGLDLIRSHPECADAVPDTEHDACIVNFYPVDDVSLLAFNARISCKRCKHRTVCLHMVPCNTTHACWPCVRP